MRNLMDWYVQTFIKVMQLTEVGRGPCYRVGCGLYVCAEGFESCFASTGEQTTWMLLRNGDMAGGLDKWVHLVRLHLKDVAWLERTLDERFIDTDFDGCYYTVL